MNDAEDELIDVTAHPHGISAVTQRGAIIGLELLLDTDPENPAD